MYFFGICLAIALFFTSCQDKQDDKVEMEEIVLDEESEEESDWDPPCELIGDSRSDACEKILEEDV